MIYLDNAATTFPKPRGVPYAVYRAMRVYGANPGRAGHDMAMDTSEQIYICRRDLAEYFGANAPEDVSFTVNCTYALNTAIKGVVSNGDHVITSNLEHNAVMRPLERLRTDGIITYSTAQVYPGNPQKTLEAFEKLIRPNTKLIVCMHVSNVFGVVLPIEQLGAMAKRHGLYFIVDAAQSAGVLPIDVKRCHIDCLCAPGHKGLYGPMGTGLLVCETPEAVRTLIEGGTGSLSKLLTQPETTPDKFESGTVNTPGIIGLKAGLDFVKRTGTQQIYTHEMEQMEKLYSGLAEIAGVKLYTPAPKPGSYAPVLSFNVRGLHSEQTAQELNSMGIATRAGLHCAGMAHRAYGTLSSGTVRIAPSAFTTARDVSGLLKSVLQIAKK